MCVSVLVILRLVILDVKFLSVVVVVENLVVVVVVVMVLVGYRRSLL
jgi:hypothetical protein